MNKTFKQKQVFDRERVREELTEHPGHLSQWLWSGTEPDNSETDWRLRSSLAEAFYSDVTKHSKDVTSPDTEEGVQHDCCFLMMESYSPSLTLSSAGALSPFLSPSVFAATKTIKIEKINYLQLIFVKKKQQKKKQCMYVVIVISTCRYLSTKKLLKSWNTLLSHRTFTRISLTHSYLLHLLLHLVWVGHLHPPSSSSAQFRINGCNAFVDNKTL